MSTEVSGRGVVMVRALKFSGLIFAIAATVMLAACASSTPADTFGLTETPTISGPARAHRQVLIANPVATQMLDSDNVVVRVSAQEYQYLGSAQWSDRLPKLVQLKLAQVLGASGKLGGAGLPGEGLAIDFQLQTTITAFEIVASGATANVEISAKLVNDRNGQVKASQVFSASVPVKGSGDRAYIAALNAAFSGVAGELASWTLARM